MRIAAIIPVHNEAWNIRRVVYNLLYTQNYPNHSLDGIIVVCSGCKDGSDTIVKEIAKKDGRVRPIIEASRHGKTHALNLAFRALKTESDASDVVVFLSGDVVPQRNAVGRLADAFEDPQVGCAISSPVPLNGTKARVDRIIGILWGMHNKMNLFGWHKVTGEMLAVKRSVLEEMPEKVINDDLYIEYLVDKNNFRFAYLPDAVAYMWGPTSYIELLEQRRRVNLGHLQAAKTYKVKHASARNTIRLIYTLFRDYSLLDATVFAIIEGLSRLLARFDNARGKRNILWRMIRTSKGGII